MGRVAFGERGAVSRRQSKSRPLKISLKLSYPAVTEIYFIFKIKSFREAEISMSMTRRLRRVGWEWE